MAKYNRFAAQFYGSPAWKNCRKAYMKKARGLCEECLKNGIIEAATDVHHKIHLTPENINDVNISLNFDNLEALCEACHNAQHETREVNRKEIHKHGRIYIGKDGAVKW